MDNKEYIISLLEAMYYLVDEDPDKPLENVAAITRLQYKLFQEIGKNGASKLKEIGTNDKKVENMIQFLSDKLYWNTAG